MQKVPHKEAIGSMQYLCTLTHWDLAFLVIHLAQFISKPAPVHWNAVKRLFRYLCGTLEKGFT
jgi:hypothetical protein